MTNVEGNLTATQYEILEVVWNHGDDGASVAEIWRAILARRSVGRTTILNLVDRLEKRSWLVRRESQRPVRYVAAKDRSRTNSLLAGSFVDDFFGGSASGLVMSLLGAERLTNEEIEHLRSVLDQTKKGRPTKKGE
jgi:predicted transcriptional regulator